MEPLAYEAVFSDAEGVYLEPPGVTRRFEYGAPLFHDCPDGQGMRIALSAPITCPPAFVFSVMDATLVGFRTILTRDGRFMTDEAYLDDNGTARYLEKLTRTGRLAEFWNERTGLVRISGGELFRLEERSRQHVEMAGTTIVLCSYEPGNYGAFLYRVLPKLTPLPDFGDYRFLVSARHPSMRELLNLLGELPDDRIVQHDSQAIYRMEHAIIPCLRNPDAFLDPETVALYEVARKRYGSAVQDRRIYVSRENWRNKFPGLNRNMLNETDLIEKLRALDFHIIEPQNLSAREQIEVFSSARLVVGPQGSGMLNVAFCHPGTQVVDIESAPNWLRAHMCFFSSCGMCYGIFEGKKIDNDQDVPGHQPFTVNIEALVERLKSLD